MKIKLTKAQRAEALEKCGKAIALIFRTRSELLNNPVIGLESEESLRHAAAHCLELATKLKGKRNRK